MIAILLAGIMVCATFAVVLPAMADNTLIQQATVASSTSIDIVAQDASTQVASIVFPEGSGGEDISDPRNDVEGLTSPQNSSNAAKPVVILKNTDTANSFVIHYNMTSFSLNTVSAEYYNITETSESSVNDAGISNSVTFDTQTTTGHSIAASGTKNLYLKVTLNAAGAGETGDSTLKIYGEAA